MSARFFFFIFFALLAVGRADPSPDEEQFLVVPGTQRITPSYDIPMLANLPKPLVKALQHYDWGTDDGSIPSEFRGFTYDLNKDGRHEYFLCNRVYSGSGGPYYMVFGEFDKRWQLIGEFQGSLHIVPTRKGWPLIVCIGRGGGGIWSKTYSEFKDGKYEDTILERYERGTITKEHLPRK